MLTVIVSSIKNPKSFAPSSSLGFTTYTPDGNYGISNYAGDIIV
jgi:hypothetical protein